MKKIGILFGQENTFPQAFIDRVNSKNVNGIVAEAVNIEQVRQGKATDYAVIIDRISQDVPFYRAYLKNAAIGGTAVINNPFWWSADEKFFNNALALSVDVAVPNTVLLPSHERPTDTDENSFRNLEFPFNWDSIFQYIGFPAYMKPHSGGGWKSVYRVENPDDLFAKHSETGQLVMMLQEEIQFTEYFRCYYLGGDRVHIMQYEPRNPHHLRYVRDASPVDQKILDKVHEGVIKLNHALGYDFNTVEFAIRDGVPYAIDFCNPAPDADIHSVGEENFEWIVENAANMAIERAKAHKDGQMNLTWGNFVKDQMAAPKKAPAKRVAKKVVPKKAAAKSAPAKPNAVKKSSPSKAAVAKKAAPAKKATPKKSTPAKKAVAAKVPVAKKAPAAKKSTPAKAPVAKKAASAKKATTVKKTVSAAKKPTTAPKTKRVTATKTTAPKAAKPTAAAKKVSTTKAKVSPKKSTKS
jgi:glutathione synthase/RimK-type ligase-like ATP-grasp enzyme